MVPTLVLAALAVLGPHLAALEEPGASPAPACAPPCGEINPRLIIQLPDLSREPFALAVGETRSFAGTITYWFDADDEGYTAPDPQVPIVITFSFPRLAPWARMSVEPSDVPVDVACPLCFNTTGTESGTTQAHYEYRVDITVSVTITGMPQRTPGYEYGKLQLFAKSTESGIYNPGYGIKEFRVQADPAAEDGFFAPAPGWGALLLGTGFATAVASSRKR